MPYTTRHPILLLLVLKAHVRVLHIGVKEILTQVQARYILGTQREITGEAGSLQVSRVQEIGRKNITGADTTTTVRLLSQKGLSI